MLSVYLKEQKKYCKSELMKILKLKSYEFLEFIGMLKAYGVLKIVQTIKEQKELSDLINDEIGLVNGDEDYFYIFTYVGVLVVGNRVLKCYPKYISKEEPLLEMKQIIKVLRKYNSKEQIINIYNDELKNNSFNKISMMLYLVEDYLENGEYTNQQEIININGQGEILWDETINETFALIKNNRPYYMELKTISFDEDEEDYFKQLHKSIVTTCSKEFQNMGISELFDLQIINDSEYTIDYFGEKEYILYKIEKALNIQFNDRKKLLLKIMYTFISESSTFDDKSDLSMFGTNSFNLVWEKVCAEIYDNCLNKKVKDLPLVKGNKQLRGDEEELGEIKLIDVINKPEWRYKKTNFIIKSPNVKTIKPDLISIYPIKNNFCFCILDAKYYLIEIKKDSISGQPGVSDITKQHLYQLAYQDFIKKVGYRYVQNAFLFPSENEEIEYIGSVKYEMMSNMGYGNLEDIKAIKLPAKKLYEAYISGEKEKTLIKYLSNDAIGISVFDDILQYLNENRINNFGLEYLNNISIGYSQKNKKYENSEVLYNIEEANISEYDIVAENE